MLGLRAFGFGFLVFGLRKTGFEGCWGFGGIWGSWVNLGFGRFWVLSFEFLSFGFCILDLGF